MCCCRFWMMGGSRIRREERWILRIQSWSWLRILERTIFWMVLMRRARSRRKRNRWSWVNCAAIFGRSFLTGWMRRSFSNLWQKITLVTLFIWSWRIWTGVLRTESCRSSWHRRRNGSLWKMPMTRFMERGRWSVIFKSMWRHCRRSWFWRIR